MTDTTPRTDLQPPIPSNTGADSVAALGHPCGSSAALHGAPSRHRTAEHTANSDTSSPSPLLEYGTQLRRRIWITRGARLNAHRRLTDANTWSMRATTFLSMYSIVAALAVAVPQFGLSTDQKEIAGVILTAFSVFTLVLSLLEAPRDYAVKAERLHRNALTLGALLDRLNLMLSRETDPATLHDGLSRIGAEYANILDACPENHEPIDDNAFRAQHREDFRISAWEAWRTTRVTAKRPFVVFYAFVWLPPILVILRLWSRKLGIIP